MGESIMEALEDRDMDVVVVDFDPNILKNCRIKKYTGCLAILPIWIFRRRARLDQAKVGYFHYSGCRRQRVLIKELKHDNRRAKVVMMALDSHDAKLLYKEGADYVILPHLAGGRQMARTYFR